MLAYWDEFSRWNNVHNLSTIKDLDEAIDLHFIDSLYPTLFPVAFSNANKILDLGTGGGFPGIPLSFYYQTINFHLLDKSRKKISFLKYASSKLNFNNVYPIHADFFNDETLYDVVVSRAVRIDNKIFSKISASISKDGWLVVFRTKDDLPFIDIKPTHRIDYILRNKSRSILFYQF
jgi:16S rRNA (guanine527-N7)-methyltransferase